jgi:tetratricopeptide (TPR) repeat protein
VGASEAPGAARRSITYAEREADSVQQIIAKARTVEKSAEQRLADGEMLFRSKDYARAIDVLNELVEKHEAHRTAYPDGMMLLGEAYYQSRQPLSARRAFRKVVDRAAEPRMAPYAPRAYARLVDVALRKQNDADLDELLKMNQAPFAGDPLVQYARAKALVARRDFNGARTSAGAVPAGHPYYHQARYLLGVVTIREAQAKLAPTTLAPGEPPPPSPPSRYAAAIEAFRQVTQLPPDTAEHQQVVDLAWMAIGRLFYEADQWFEAADAYNHVDRQSPEFGASLFELAWVYVRLGDTDRAARALEVLSIADPKNAYMADGTLLRADLLLRSGQFDKALSAYQAVRAEYDPMRERVDGFLSSTTDPAVYYDKLAQEELETVDNTSQLPALAVQLAREERDGASAFAVLDDVSQCRDLIRKSQRLVFKLRTVLGAPNHVRAFPELRAGDEKLLQLLNRLALARGTIAEGLDDAEPAEVSGELAQVRRERRELGRRLQGLPLTDADLITREAVAQRQWNSVSQRLQQLQLEVDQMQAVVNGLKRLVSDANGMAGRNPTMVRQWQAELTAGERDLKGYREQIEGVRQSVEAGKVQVGYGDQRFVDDENLRNAFRDKLRQEVQLVAGGAAGGDSAAYANRVAPVLAQADATENRLLAMRRDIDVEVTKRAAELSAIVEREAINITAYGARLESLDQEARLVVGQVAMRNFGLVRDRLKNIVLRADVGTVEQAWEVREEQVTRVRNLQAERVREEQILREELREVLDDATDAPPPAPAPLPTEPPMPRVSRPRGSRFGRPPARRARLAAALAFAFALAFALDAASQQPRGAPSASAPPGGAAPARPAAPGATPAGPGGAGAAPAGPGVTGAASAAPAGSASFGAAPGPYSPPSTPAALRRSAPPPPPPSAGQLQTLERYRREVGDYERDARDFRDAITSVVKHHYEERRRRILNGLDREIGIERAELRRAREEAIRRLEEFIGRYSGPNTHAEHTPDAMFRLAALYEERARTDTPPEQLVAQLKPALALYKRLIREFPKYRERSAVFYYLGHALNDSDRAAEAQQVWRSLVCQNKYPYPVPTDPADPDKDLIVRKPQDHDEKYWEAWSNMHQQPIGARAKRPGAKPPARGRPTRAGEAEPLDAGEELSYVAIYSDECQPIPQRQEPGREPRYLAEVWWLVGDYHFEQLDTKGGPYNYNRAVSAYRLAMKSVQDRAKSVVYGVAMYKLAWTYFKQQRYEAAVKQFIELLHYTDEREAATGDPGADFRKEAYDYIAGSLTYVDFAGPGEDEPYIARVDVLDTEPNPAVAEQKMRVALERAQDPRLIPQDKKWTIEIYRALAREYREINQLANATATLELVLQKYPMHRDAPVIQNEIAILYDERARLAKDGSPERDLYAARALDARTKLAQYVGNTPWVDANRDDPEAIQTAERLVRGGLRQAAVEHTNNARAFVAEANQSTVDAEKRRLLDKAVVEYKLAESGWEGYLRQDENSTDAYESRFWLADSRYWQTVLQVSLAQRVPPEQYARARASAIEVRDSNEDDRFLEPSAQYVVSLADTGVQEQYNLFKSSGGREGIEERNEVRTTGEGKNLRVDTTPLPPAIAVAVAARDEFVARVPPASDPSQNGQLFRFQAAQLYFFYGQFDEATRRFEPIYRDQCRQSKYGYLAWEKLQKMANIQAELTGDTRRATELARAETNPQTQCCMSEAECAVATSIANNTIKSGAYKDAAAAFERAQQMPDGPERVKQWRLAAALYEQALQAAPDRNEAPEAAINGAYAYKQVGEYDKAIAMYRLFIDKYGDDKLLADLQKGPKANPAEYKKRVDNLGTAYNALAQAYVLFFNYRAAAETNDKIASIDRFEGQQRKDSARNALVLYSNLGDRERMTAARARLLSLKPSAEEKAEADYIVASADFKAWDERGADADQNRVARQRATQSLSQYYDANRNNPAAARYNVNAAYHVARMRRAANDRTADDWWTNTIKSFERYKVAAPPKDGRSSALGSPEGDMAAEADFTLADADVRKNFDYDTGHHRYAGTVVDVTKKYNADAKDAQKYHERLKRIADVNTYGSVEYVTAALARQGSLYDSLRTGLFNTREPALKLFTPQEEAILKKLENSGNEDLSDKAAERRDQRTQLWRQKRDQELTSADTIMVQRYVQAVAIARRYRIRSAAVNRALQRLAFFTDVLGDAKMRQYSAGIEGFTYEDGMFQKTRPGMVVEPQVPPLPGPAPAVLR